MAHFIEVEHLKNLSSIKIQQGDLLSFKASGGQVTEGAACIELVGYFLSSLTDENGEVISPMGPPNVVLFAARAPGRARIEVYTGDPWVHPFTSHLCIIVR